LFDARADDDVRRTLWPLYHPERFADGRLTQPALAATLSAVARGGADEFYRGPLGQRLAAGAAGVGSPLTVDDLAKHEAAGAEPGPLPYRGGAAASVPPPTQGCAALAILGLLEGFDLASLDDADLVHLTVEATKLAFEDRDRWLTDPDVVDVPVAVALDRERLTERRRLISRRAARRVDGPPAAGDTVAVMTADHAGNAVSMIQSLYHEFGAGVAAGGGGGAAVAVRSHVGRADEGAAARVALRRCGGRAPSRARPPGAGRGAVERSHGPRPGHRARHRWSACGLRPPRRWRGERLVTMSAWRWGVYRVSYYIGRGLIRAARILAYATAGVLTRKELGRAAAGRWSDCGIDETYVLSGLFT